MAVGFENGSVIVLKGDITKDRYNKLYTLWLFLGYSIKFIVLEPCGIFL
jgi:hypothetical protein